MMTRFCLTFFLTLSLAGCGSCGDKKNDVPPAPEGEAAAPEAEAPEAEESTADGTRTFKGAPGIGTAPQAEAVPDMAKLNDVLIPAEKNVQKAPAAPDGKAVNWSGPIQWVSYHEAIALAKESGKPIFLLFYADWCPKCRVLGPIFAEDKGLHALAEKVIMVRANQMGHAQWMDTYKTKGRYVPRAFFLNAKGELQEDLKSSHPRFPYFYAASQMKQLKSNMRKAMGR